MKTLNILSFSLILILHISIDLRSQEIPDHRAENYIPQERDFSQFPLNLNSNTTNTWEQLHPTIPRVDYWGVYFIDTATGFAVGDGGALIKTIDGGLTWRTIESGVTTLLRTIGSYDGSTIVAAGDLGKIIISTDVGETWTELQSVVPHHIWKIQFVTDQIGWLVGTESTALKTTDGGFSWVNIQTPLSGFPYWDVSFYDTSFGYMCTNFGLVLRTTDGGSSWDIRETETQHHLYTIKAITRQKAVSFGGLGKQAYTDNGGESWQVIYFFLSLDPYKITFLDTLRGIVVGFGGALFTTNGGLNWTYGGGIIAGTDITFVNDKTGYLVATGMDLHKSTNSGQSWYSTIINDNITDVFFTSDSVGWFIGRYIYAPVWTTLYKSTDGGRTLTPQSNIPGSKPSSVYFLDSLTGIVGAENAIFKTTDGGGTWIEKPVNNLPGNGGVYDRIFFVDENTGWAKSSYVIKTTNSGESWNFQLEDGLITEINFSDPLNGWVTRSGNGIKPLKTTNGGNTWLVQTHISLDDTYAVFFKDNLNGFITTRKFIPPNSWGLLYETSNGGLNWSVPDSSITNLPSSTRFSNLVNSNIYLSGFGPVYRSSNIGETWNEVIELRGMNIYHVNQIQYHKKLDIAVGTFGLVSRFVDSLMVGVNENPTIFIPEGYSLSQNYPNPFNANTAIEFALPIPGHVRISIYDISGRLIIELINGQMNPGVHKVIFNTEQLSSGIYYLKLESGKFNQTRKMVLIN